jgi:hypothetical protein
MKILRQRGWSVGAERVVAETKSFFLGVHWICLVVSKRERIERSCQARKDVAELVRWFVFAGLSSLGV